MSKLKKKIKELCGLSDMPKEELLVRAYEILHNTQLKQNICNSVQGLSFKDIDKVMIGILNNSKLPIEDIASMHAVYVNKIDLQSFPILSSIKDNTVEPLNKENGVKIKKIKYINPTPEDVARLINMSNTSIKSEPLIPARKLRYEPLSLEDCSRLVKEYDEHKNKNKNKKHIS